MLPSEADPVKITIDEAKRGSPVASHCLRGMRLDWRQGGMYQHS
jgi:hypothetical protein